MISWSSSFASSTPATSLNVTFFCELDESFALLLPNESALLPPLCIWRMKKIQKPISRRMGAQEYSSCAQGLCVGSFAVDENALRDRACWPDLRTGRARRCGRFPCRRGKMPLISWPVMVTFSTLPASTSVMKSLNGTGFDWALEPAWKNSTPRPPRRPEPSRTLGFSTWSSPSTLPRLNRVPVSRLPRLLWRSVTLNSSASACPATHTICPAESTITGVISRSNRSIFASTKKSCSFFRPLSPSGRKRVSGTPVPHRQRRRQTAAPRSPPRRCVRPAARPRRPTRPDGTALDLGRNRAGRLRHRTLGPAPRADR